MNLEKGLRRLMIAVTIPVGVIGISMSIYGYAKTSALNKKIDATLFSEEPAPKQELTATSKNQSKHTHTWEEDPIVDPATSHLLSQCEHFKTVGFIGLLLLASCALLWGIFFSGVWISKGFKG